ncbi:MAG: hypothetical protein AB7E68_02090 [Candidatus Babeliales bacterium]
MKLYFLVTILFLLPSCTPYAPWFKDVFYQGEHTEYHKDTVRQYIRSEHVYDAFSTLAHFDAVWLSCELLDAYAQAHAQKYCLDECAYNSFLREQHAAVLNKTSFYVLSAIPDCYATALDDKNPVWSAYLVVDNVCCQPTIIKECNMPVEYRSFFARAYNRFKKSYEIVFEQVDVQHAKMMQLIFARTDRKVVLTWQLDGCGKVIYQKLERHPDILVYDLECCP